MDNRRGKNAPIIGDDVRKLGNEFNSEQTIAITLAHRSSFEPILSLLLLLLPLGAAHSRLLVFRLLALSS